MLGPKGPKAMFITNPLDGVESTGIVLQNLLTDSVPFLPVSLMCLMC